MGIDIYAHWAGQTKAEKDAQRAKEVIFSPMHGHVGYLREAYHGEPYATRYLVAEAFSATDREVTIRASVLRERLPHTLALAEERERTVYNETDVTKIEKVKKSFVNFVELCERKEKESGWPCLIEASY